MTSVGIMCHGGSCVNGIPEHRLCGRVHKVSESLTGVGIVNRMFNLCLFGLWMVISHPCRQSMCKCVCLTTNAQAAIWPKSFRHVWAVTCGLFCTADVSVFTVPNLSCGSDTFAATESR